MKKNRLSAFCIFSLFLTIKSPIFAQDLAKPRKQDHFLHEFMYKHEYLAVPIATLVVGAISGGAYKYDKKNQKEKKLALYMRIYGGIVGFTLGAIDQILVTKGWAHRYFLSSGVIATGVLSKFNLDMPLMALDKFVADRRLPYVPKLHSGKIPFPFFGGLDYSGAHIFRFSLGLAAAEGAFDNIKDYVPLHGLIAGMVLGKEKWSLIGGAVEIADKVLMANNVTARPYGTQVIDGLVFSKIFIPHIAHLGAQVPFLGGLVALGESPLKEGIGILVVNAASLYPTNITTNSTSTADEQWKAVELSQNLLDLSGSLVDEKILTSHLQKQTIVLLASEILSVHINLLLMEYYQAIDEMFAKLDDRESTSPSSIRKPLIGLSLFTGPYFLRKLVLKYIEDYFSSSLTKQMSDALYQEFLSGESPLKLAQNATNEALVAHMRKDLETLGKASEILASAVDASVTGTFSIGYLYSTDSLDLIAYLFVYDKFFERVIEQLSQWEAGYAPILRDYETKLGALELASFRHADLVVRSDQLPFLKELHEKFTQESRAVYEKWRLTNAVLLAITLPKGMLDYVISYLVVSFKVYDGDVAFDDRMKITQLGAKTAEFLSWKSAKSGTIKQIEQASSSLKSLVDQLNEEKDSDCQKLVYSSERSEALGIEIRDFAIALGSDKKPFIQAEHLNLEQGIYALKGRSGSGKSSFLAKVKGLQHDQLCASGQILYKTQDGKAPTISFVTQSDFFPPNTSLFQLASYRIPAHERASLVTKTIELLKELDFDSADTNLLDSLHEEKDWQASLSGGQKKKLALVALMLTNPHIAILDESFTGLDVKSIKKAQTMLKRLLPNTLFLVVDHHADSNNDEGFYDHELLFEDGQIFAHK